jgi:NADH-quinone oxidoreductase subunit H
MALGWSVMLPVVLGYIVVVATATLLLDMAGVARGLPFSLALFALNVLLLALLIRWLDRGKLISPASARLGTAALARRRARARPAVPVHPLTAGAEERS